MNRVSRLALAAVFFVGGALEVQSQTFARKPNLQMGSPTQARVCWRLSEATSLTVKYGTDSTNLNLTSPPTAANANTCAVLTGLQPKTKYYYKVFNGTTEIPGAQNQFLVTHPPVGDKGKHTFWLLGDPGTGGNGGTNATAANRVREGFLRKNGGPHVDGLLLLGDQAYEQGTDAQFTANYFNIYPNIISNTFAWATMGNHENMTTGATGHLGAYYLPDSGQSGGVPSGSERYYSFNYGNIHFICLDSESSPKTTSSAMYAWLQQDLQATTADWIVAFYHHTPYTKGHHDSDTEQYHIDMRQNFQPLMEQYGLDLHFGGHSHLYERTYLIDSAYGLSSNNQLNRARVVLDSTSGNPNTTGAYRKNQTVVKGNKGAVYVMAGSSGKLQTGSQAKHPMVYSMQRHFGSTILTIQDSVATVEWIDTTGLVRDSFQIIQVRPVVGIDKATGQKTVSGQKFTYSGRNFRFAPDNVTSFHVYQPDGKLVVSDVPQGGWALKESLAPAGEYYYRYGTAYGKLSIR